MKQNRRRLSDLRVGEAGTVVGVTGEPGIARRILEMGVVAGERVKVTAFAPLGDPMKIEVQGYQLSLRSTEARGIEVDPS